MSEHDAWYILLNITVTSSLSSNYWNDVYDGIDGLISDQSQENSKYTFAAPQNIEFLCPQLSNFKGFI